MTAATLTAKGQIVIPSDIRRRFGLTPGTQIEFLDDGGELRLVIRRRVAPSDPEAGYGLIKVPPPADGRPRGRLSEFDPASTLARKARGR